MQNLLAHRKNWTHYNWVTSESQSTSSMGCIERNRSSCSRCCTLPAMANSNNKSGNSNNWQQQLPLLLTLVLLLCSPPVNADEDSNSKSTTSALTSPGFSKVAAAETQTTEPTDWQPIVNASTTQATPARQRFNGSDSILLRFARSFSSGNELWDGIVRDCYLRPDMSCFQKNIYSYLDGALSQKDVNITQRLKFYRNQVQYEPEKEKEESLTEARSAVRPESPIEEVSNAFYGKTIKFAMTHDVEVDLPEIVFNGATFRISPRSIEGNGLIAKLELIPKQIVQARLAGTMIKKKIHKFLRNKLLLSFIALVLIIKIIKIKLFWLLPIIIGVGAAKKLLLKFLLFLFPALTHLFKLCSYYQQSYHGTKYHHHQHHINHHHTVVPPWYSGEHHGGGPELIFTHPPKGHPSAYLHGAPVHESYGPGPGHEHFEGAWENSGPGLGSEYIGDINRAAQVEDNAPFFKPHTANDANELHAWGLGTTPSYHGKPPQQAAPSSAATQQQQPQRWPNQSQQQRPPTHQQQQHLQQQQQQKQQQHLQQQQQQQIGYQKLHASSHSLNKLQSLDPQSSRPAFGQHNPVYVPAPGPGPARQAAAAAAGGAASSSPPDELTAAAQFVAQNPQLSPQLSAQLKEAIRIQAEQRLIQQQQQILGNQPFVQDGQPLYPLNYDPFYSPILLKIDKIIEQLGVKSDLCKERIVCNMYKDPAEYSPHSNFISAELSRDTNELEPVTHANEAVRRFYRLIQAARDGQDQKDCQSLYPQCNTVPAK